MHKFLLLLIAALTLAFSTSLIAQDSVKSDIHEYSGNTHFFYETLVTDSMGRVSGHKRQVSIFLAGNAVKSRMIKRDLKKLWRAEVKKVCLGWFMGSPSLILTSSTQELPKQNVKVIGISGDFKCVGGR